MEIWRFGLMEFKRLVKAEQSLLMSLMELSPLVRKVHLRQIAWQEESMILRFLIMFLMKIRSPLLQVAVVLSS